MYVQAKRSLLCVEFLRILNHLREASMTCEIISNLRSLPETYFVSTSNTVPPLSLSA